MTISSSWRHQREDLYLFLLDRWITPGNGKHSGRGEAPTWTITCDFPVTSCNIRLNLARKVLSCRMIQVLQQGERRLACRRWATWQRSRGAPLPRPWNGRVDEPARRSSAGKPAGSALGSLPRSDSPLRPAQRRFRRSTSPRPRSYWSARPASRCAASRIWPRPASAGSASGRNAATAQIFCASSAIRRASVRSTPIRSRLARSIRTASTCPFGGSSW